MRCDKSISSAGLEVRVPFLDIDFLEFYMSINPYLKIPAKILDKIPSISSNSKIEKYLLRDSFNQDNRQIGLSDILLVISEQLKLLF